MIAIIRKQKNHYFTVDQLDSLYSELLSEIKPHEREQISHDQRVLAPTLPDGEKKESDSMKNMRQNILSTKSKPKNARGASSIALSAAWRTLSASVSPDKEGPGYTCAPQRDGMTVDALDVARRCVSRVVEIIRGIGEIVIYGEKNPQLSLIEPIFAYFCDKNMLSLFVNIVTSKPPLPTFGAASLNIQRLHEVTYTAQVKSQVLQTVHTLVSHAQDPKSLIYLLSNNMLNELLLSLTPLSQWTEIALEEMMPTYTSVLKTLALQLASMPDLHDLFVHRVSHSSQIRPMPSFSFPLMKAAVEVATSSYAQSDTFVQLTAFNIILNICQIPSDLMKCTLSDASDYQFRLFSFLSNKMVARYTSNVLLTTCSSGDDRSIKSDALSRGITELQDQIHFLNDLLSCGLQSFNVRLCEVFLKMVIFRPLLSALLVSEQSMQDFTFVEASSNEAEDDVVPYSDVVSDIEAKLLVSIHFLGQCFLTLEYKPLLKMIAVALLHPYTPGSLLDSIQRTSEDFTYTTALHDIASMLHVPTCAHYKRKNNCPVLNNKSFGSTRSKPILNPFRRRLLCILRGDLGDRVAVPAFQLLQSILEANAIDHAMLTALNIFPYLSKPTFEQPECTCVPREISILLADGSSTEIIPSPIEKSIEFFLRRSHEASSSVLTLAMECLGSLILTYMSLVHLQFQSMALNKRPNHSNEIFFHWQKKSPIVSGLILSNAHYAGKALDLQNSAEVAELFVDLVETEITKRYTLNEFNTTNNQMKLLSYCLNSTSAFSLRNSAVVLINRSDNVCNNAIEETRLSIRICLHLLGIITSLSNFGQRMRNVTCDDQTHQLRRWKCNSLEEADGRVAQFLKELPAIGTELDLRGRTIFLFSSPKDGFDEANVPSNKRNWMGGKRIHGNVEALRNYARQNRELFLVVDPTALFVAVSDPKYIGNTYRGIVLSSSPMQAIIATATDGSRLHIAVRHADDIGFVIRNGNMLLCFDAPGTAQIVHQYIERCRVNLRTTLQEDLRCFFHDCQTKKDIQDY